MKTRRRTFLPGIHALEERVNLSFSVSSVVHSLFPFIPDHTNKVKHHPAVVRTHPATTLPPLEASAHPRLAAARAAHLKVMGQPTGPLVHTAAHPRGLSNWYAAKPATSAVRAR